MSFQAFRSPLFKIMYRDRAPRIRETRIIGGKIMHVIRDHFGRLQHPEPMREYVHGGKIHVGHTFGHMHKYGHGWLEKMLHPIAIRHSSILSPTYKAIRGSGIHHYKKSVRKPKKVKVVHHRKAVKKGGRVKKLKAEEINKLLKKKFKGIF